MATNYRFLSKALWKFFNENTVDPTRVSLLEKKVITDPNVISAKEEGIELTPVPEIIEEFPYHIILDLGHQVITTNKEFTYLGKTLKEWWINWGVGEELIKKFKANNISYSITYGKYDLYGNGKWLQGRVNKANAIIHNTNKPCLFLSIHHDAYDGKRRGSTMYIHNRHSLDSFKLAQALSSIIPYNLDTRDRNVKTANFTVLTVSCPSVLLELEFFDNPKHWYWLQSQEYHKLAAQSIVEGLLKFKDNKLQKVS